MSDRKSNLYDVLGLTASAKQSDIIRVYRRLTDEMQSEAAAPNPRRAALVHEAYEVLSDPERRIAYDKSLRTARFSGARKESSLGKGVTIAAVAVIGLAAAWYFTLGRSSDSRSHPAALSLQQVQAAAAVSVGRVNRVEISGTRSVLAAAVAVEEGVMMAPCAGIDPAAQIVVRIPPRDIPAQLKSADAASGLCRLAVSGGGSWPLSTTGVLPRPGDKVFAADLNALGEVVVTSGEVSNIIRGPKGEVIESTARAATPVEGTPLLDQQGRVVAIAIGGQHVVLPKAAVVKDGPAARRPEPDPPTAPTSGPAPDAAAPADPTDKVSPEKRERLEKAFRPPPQVPKDL